LQRRHTPLPVGSHERLVAASRERILQAFSTDGDKLQRLFAHLHLKFGLFTPLPGDYLERYRDTEDWPHSFLDLLSKEFNAIEVEVDTILSLANYHENCTCIACPP